LAQAGIGPLVIARMDIQRILLQAGLTLVVAAVT